MVWAHVIAAICVTGIGFILGLVVFFTANRAKMSRMVKTYVGRMFFLLIVGGMILYAWILAGAIALLGEGLAAGLISCLFAILVTLLAARSWTEHWKPCLKTYAQNYAKQHFQVYL